MGRIKAISTSKIKKIIAIKKNRIENGIRDEQKGLKPHSKGEAFSCSKFFFFDNREDKIITIYEIKKINKIKNNRFRIIYIKKILNFMIGSQIYLLYYINFFI